MKKIALLLFVLLVAPLVACESKTAEDAEATAETAPESGEATEEAATAEERLAQKEDDAGPTTQPSKPEKAELPEDMKTGDTQRFGGEFTVEEEPMTLAKALEMGETEGPVKLEAGIQKVCKKKGCWFTLHSEDVEPTIRVRMKDYGFFVPRNTEGATAVVEGVLKAKELSPEEATHYKKDEAGEGEKVEPVREAQKEWEVTASTVEITQS